MEKVKSVFIYHVIEKDVFSAVNSILACIIPLPMLQIKLILVKVGHRKSAGSVVHLS